MTLVAIFMTCLVVGDIIGGKLTSFAPIKNDLRYTSWRTVFTGISKKPLRRPPVFFG